MFGRLWAGERSHWPALDAIEQWERLTRTTDLPRNWRISLKAIPAIDAFVNEVGALEHKYVRLDAQIQELLDDLQFDVQVGCNTSHAHEVPFAVMQRKFGVFAESPSSLGHWCIWHAWSNEARANGLDAIVDRLDSGAAEPSTAVLVFQYACFEALARQAFATHASLSEFDGGSHERILTEFRRFDLERLQLARAEVRAHHAEMIPRGRSAGEMGILAMEWRKQRRHLALRQLVRSAGRAMQSIKPVWMMSPMSLAQYVPPGSLQFDLVVMDEASQVKPVEALGAIARARQLVVVGDEKQLPPTSFFDRVTSDDGEPEEPDDAPIALVESILGLCAARGLPDTMLRWHYRSQHESLIAISNLEFYQRLFIVPSAHRDGLGLSFRFVPDGVYDRGRTRVNRAEAALIAQHVMRHALEHGKSERHPTGMTLGVGAFSVTQRDAVLDEIELLRRKHPESEAFFDPDAPEPFFVKNLESIQGDERDVILISVGFGPDENGVVSMNFGPLGQAGGERRLNVLISRARRRCVVYSSLKSDQIDLSRTQSFGIRVLKTFLQYAETGHLERAVIGKRPPDSDFEEDVAQALTAAGYEVEHQVGVAGFFVDLGVRNPERPGSYFLGIECDGAAYHSTRSARDRDRLREQVLRDRGWQIHRIWGTDWYRGRQEQIQRAIAAIEQARFHAPPSVPTTPAADLQRDPGNPDESTSPPARPEPMREILPPYREADFVEQLSVEPHQLSTTKLIGILVRIVEVEGPIHGEELSRRYTTVCGKGRAGRRIQDAVSDALNRAAREGQVHNDAGFYSVTPLTECAPRDRSQTASLTVRQPDMLPPVEIRTGLLRAVEDHVGVSPNEAVTEVARMLGFQRTGQELRRVLESEIRELLGDGKLILRQERLYLPDP